MLSRWAPGGQVGKALPGPWEPVLLHIVWVLAPGTSWLTRDNYLETGSLTPRRQWAVPRLSPGSQVVLPRHTHDRSPAAHVLQAGGSWPVYIVQSPCVLPIQGRSYTHHRPQHPAPQQWPRAPCAELHTPPITGGSLGPVSICPFLLLRTPFSRC